LALGLLADRLFNGAELGINVTLWDGALIGAFVFVARRGWCRIAPLPASLLAVAFGLALMVAWRAAAELQTGLLVGTVAALLLAFVVDDDTRARRASATFLLGSLAIGVLSAASGVLDVARSMPLRSMLARDGGAQARALGRALLRFAAGPGLRRPVRGRGCSVPELDRELAGARCWRDHGPPRVVGWRNGGGD